MEKVRPNYGGGYHISSVAGQSKKMSKKGSGGRGPQFLVKKTYEQKVHYATFS